MLLCQNRLLHKELFYTKAVLSTNTMFYTKTYKNHVLAGPVQVGLFAAYRIALSMLAGGAEHAEGG